MAMTEIEAAWLAGLLEGDGCFHVADNKTNKGIVRVSLAMSDEDVVRKAASIMNTTVTKSIITKGNKQMWETRTAIKSKVREILLQIFPYMGQRRTSKILTILDIINRKEKGEYFE